MRRYGKRDLNHREIVNGLRFAGCSVLDLADLGDDKPDILVATRTKTGKRRSVLLEIKSEDGKVSERQADWHQAWKGEVYVVRSLSEALLVMGIK